MVSWVAKSWLGAWGGHLQQQIFVGVCGVGRWGEPRFKHKTESETDILHAFLWVPAWSGIHLKQALLLLCPGYSRTNQKGPENNPLTGSIQTLLMWIRAESTGEHPQIMCSVFQRNRNFSSLLLVPMLWNVACDDAGKGMRFLGEGEGWDVNGWDSHLRSFPRSLWYPGQVPWLPYLIFISCKIRQILFVFQISPILTTGKVSWATEGTQRHLRSILWLWHCTSVLFHHIHSRAIKKWINFLNLMLKKPSRFPFCWLSPH